MAGDLKFELLPEIDEVDYLLKLGL